MATVNAKANEYAENIENNSEYLTKLKDHQLRHVELILNLWLNRNKQDERKDDIMTYLGRVQTALKNLQEKQREKRQAQREEIVKQNLDKVDEIYLATVKHASKVLLFFLLLLLESLGVIAFALITASQQDKWTTQRKFVVGCSGVGVIISVFGICGYKDIFCLSSYIKISQIQRN